MNARWLQVYFQLVLDEQLHLGRQRIDFADVGGSVLVLHGRNEHLNAIVIVREDGVNGRGTGVALLPSLLALPK